MHVLSLFFVFLPGVFYCDLKSLMAYLKMYIKDLIFCLASCPDDLYFSRPNLPFAFNLCFQFSSFFLKKNNVANVSQVKLKQS